MYHPLLLWKVEIMQVEDLKAFFPGPNNNPNSSLFQLINNHGTPEEALSICRIGSITITYLPAPISTPIGCDANCEAAIHSYLPDEIPNVDINTSGQTVTQGIILGSEYGIVVVVRNNNSNPAFVSLCKAEIINK